MNVFDNLTGMNQRLLFTITLLIFALQLFSQTGTITGTITDAETHETLVGTTVVIQGTTTGSITDFDGHFIISKVAVGTYSLQVSFVSYDTQILQVEVIADVETKINVALEPASLDIGEVQVVARINRQSESMLLVEQKNSVLATQAIGAQEISRKGVSDAEGAVSKVSGISKQEGVKNVFVRGLGDRYNSTSLNGFPVPSEDPEYKNISLDYFESDMIQSVGVSKVFGSEMTGDVGGAEINIRSKELTVDNEFGIEASLGVNSQTLNHKFLKPDGVNALGYANKKQGSLVLSDYSFQNALDPSSQNFQLNQSYSVFGGRTLSIGINRNPLRFYLIGKYAADYNYVSGVVRNTTTTGTIFQDQDFDKYEKNTSHMLMANIDYRFKNQKLSYNGLYIHANVQSVGDYRGLNAVYEDADDYRGFLRRQQTNDNSLIINQILSEWKLSDRWILDAGSSVNLVEGNEPDRRMNYLSEHADGVYRLTKGTGRQQRYFSAMNETDFNVKIEASYKLSMDVDNPSSIRFGYNGRFVKRTFEAIEYDQQIINQPNFSTSGFRLNDFFSQKGLSNGDFMLDRNLDEYSVDKFINSAYGELVCQLNDKLVGIAGARFEKVNINVDYNVNRGGTQGKTNIDDLYILPSINLKYDFTEKSSFRVGASKTYTLPQAKEISPFRYVDVSFKSQGNPNLKSSENYNLDLKWDYYMSSDELFSMNGFYKFIKDPISRVEKASAGGFLSYDNIADKAAVAGIEMELRKNIFKLLDEGSGINNKLSVGINSSYILTDVKLRDANFTNDKSQLEGAAPIIVNADLSYNTNKYGFSLTNSFILNYFSNRIYTIGTQGYQDIVEKGIPTLDFVSSVKMNRHWELNLKAKNLLNPNFQLSRKPNDIGKKSIVLSDYKKGVFISLGISYNL